MGLYSNLFYDSVIKPQQQNIQPQEQANTGLLSPDEFHNQYSMAKAAGLSTQDAVAQIKAGKRFDSWQPPAVETPDYSDTYKGKTGVQRAASRVGSVMKGGFADVASGLGSFTSNIGSTVYNAGADLLYGKDSEKAKESKAKTAQAVERIKGITDPIKEYSQEQKEKAKYGLADNFGGKAASFLLDTLGSAPGMIADAAVGATGMNGLSLMAARVYGNAVDNAKARGIDDNRAGLYGIASATIETATEMIGGETVLGRLAYGNKGLLNSAIENTVAKLAGKPVAQFLTQYAMGAGSEALEEVMSQAAEPFVESILEEDYGKALLESLQGKVADPVGTAKEFLLAGLGGALMAIGGNVVTDVGTGTVNTIRGAEGPRTATGQQLAEINAKYGIEQSPEATAAYQKAVDEGKSEGEAMVAGQTAKYQSDKQAENYKILNDYILGVNENKELAQRGKDDFRMVSNQFAQAKGNSVLIDKNGDEVGRVVYKGGDGFVVRLANGKKEPVFTNGISGSIDRSTETYKALTNGGQFQDANIFEAVQERQAQQKMASQQEVAPETPANPAPAQQATQPEQPAPQPAPQQAQR